MTKTEYAGLAFDAGFEAGKHAGFWLPDGKEPEKTIAKNFGQFERITNFGESSLDEALSALTTRPTVNPA